MRGNKLAQIMALGESDDWLMDVANAMESENGLIGVHGSATAA